jgi:hypothetical protein
VSTRLRELARAYAYGRHDERWADNPGYAPTSDFEDLAADKARNTGDFPELYDAIKQEDT